MIINKNIYKYIAVISFAIVLILLANLIVPTFTWAEEINNSVGFLSDINYNENEKTLSVSGTLPDGVTEYKLYWSTGEIPMEKLPENATDEEKDRKIDNLIAWSIESGHLLTDVVKSNSREINSVVIIENDRSKDVQYNVLCVATENNGYRIMQMKVLKLGAKVVVDNNVTVYGNSNEKQEDGKEEHIELDKQLSSINSNAVASNIQENVNQQIRVEEEDKEAEGINDDVIEITVTPKNQNQKVEDDGYISIDEPTEVKPQATEVEVKKTQTEEVKKEDVKTTELKKEETDKNKVKVEENKTNDTTKKEINTTDAMVAQQEIPQTGSNDMALVFGIILFSMISIVSFVKYLKVNE